MNDREVFYSSLGLFTERIKKVLSGEENVIVALSRKGPRLLESLFRQDELYGKVISEHALPFFFYRLLTNLGIQCNIYVVDDAIYYGSTVKALMDEIQWYIHQFNLCDRVCIKGIIAVIKEPGSMDITIDDKRPLANDDVREGYGHYFVKQVMDLIKSAGTPLEIEFPVLKYELEKNVKVEQIYEALKETYRHGNVGLITDNEGMESVSLIMSDFDEITFRKLRIYIKNDELLITVIAPELVPSNFNQLKYAAFGNERSTLTYLWKELYFKLLMIYNKIQGKGGSTRNIERTAIILLNFLSSIDTYCCEKWKIEDALADYVGYHPKAHLDGMNVNYLSEASLSQFIVGKIEKFVNSNEHSLFPMNMGVHSSEYLVRESLTITEADKDALMKSNMTGVYQSKTVEEALSVMMFNQMIMIEKMSRYIRREANYRSRLLFGYSYHSIVDFLRRYASGLKGEDIFGFRVHRWIDSQIDNGCVVPQYIVDSKNNQWTRVFRPGENEDVLLSHLGRFVAFVIYNMFRSEKDLSSYKVLKDNLNGVLTYVYLKTRDELIAQEPLFHFNVHERHFLYTNDKSESIVDFLARMSVLTIENEQEVSLNSRLQIKEFAGNTTLTEDLSTKVSSLVKLIVNRLPKDKTQAAYLYPNTINYFLLDYFDKNLVWNAIDRVGSVAIEKIEEIIRSMSKGDYDGQKAAVHVMHLVQSYTTRLSHYELKSNDISSERICNHPLWECVIRVRRLLFAINLLLIIVYKHISIQEYLKRQSVANVKDMLKCNDLIDVIEHSTEDFIPNIKLLETLKNYIISNVLT